MKNANTGRDPLDQIDSLLKSKNQEISDLSHTLRHDLRNYLAAIEGYIYLLKDEFNPDYLERIEKNSKQISLVIDKAVDLADSSLLTDSKEEIDLESLLNDKKKINVNSVEILVKDLKKIRGDYLKVLKAFEIIVKSAIKYRKATKIEIQGVTGESEYIINCIDNGETLSQDQATKMLRKTQSLKESQGFEIFYFKKLVEAHNWDVQFKQTENGNTFEIKVPIHDVIE